MSKIVCDICGTTYDDAAGSCPVCGWSQDGTLNVDSADFSADFTEEDLQLDDLTSEAAAPTQKGKVAFDYDAVNNRRRPAPKPSYPVSKAEEEEDDEDEDDEEESGSNTFLVVILVLLILALLAVSAYIGWTKILKPKMGSDSNKPTETITAQVEETTNAIDITETSAETVLGVPCTGLTPVGQMQKLTSRGQNYRLMVKAEPEDTTDTVVYTSNNENVVTIDEWGRVTAVDAGETTITVTCGSQQITIAAVVEFEPEQTEATTVPEVFTPTTPDAGTTVATPSSTLKLKKTDITIGGYRLSVTLETEGGIALEDIKWSTSDSSVANVYNGTVTCMGRGVCVITAKYNGQEATCVVRCKY